MAATASDRMQSTNTNTITTTIPTTKSQYSTEKQEQNVDEKNADTITADITMSSSSSHCFASKEKIDNIDENLVKKLDNNVIGSTSSANAANIMEHATKIEMKNFKIEEEMKPMRRKQRSGATDRDELAEGEIEKQQYGCVQIPIEHTKLFEDDKRMVHDVSSALMLSSFFDFSFYFDFVVFFLFLFCVVLC